MIKKMIVFIGAVACTCLVVTFAPGFAREIGAGVMPFNKIQLRIGESGLVINLPTAACPHEPWPYGCGWRASTGRKQTVKKARTRNHRYALTTVH